VLPPLALAGSIRAIIDGGGALFQGLGHPAYTFRMNLVGVVAMYLVIFPLLFRYGLPGVGFAASFGMLAALPIFVWQSASVLKLGVWPVIRTLVPGSLLSLGVATALLAVQDVSGGRVALLLLWLAVSGAVFVVMSGLLWGWFQVGPFRAHLLLRSRRESKRSSTGSLAG
jgi:O-antigen/teichoic acid export membrane protein